jgi:hypothetical protein
MSSNGGRRRTLLLCALVLAAWEGLAEETLQFTELEDGSYSFNTGVLSGKLRHEGKSVGLLPVTWVATGEVLTRSMGFAGHYRVFSGSQRFGAGAWYWPSSSKLLADGSVEVNWPVADDRPFELSAVYRWSGRAMLDVETRVRPRTDLPDFESFVAFYFNDTFSESSVLGHGKLMAAEQAEGAWQMFPRDAAAVRLIQDGRWKAPPNTVDWTIRPQFAHPVGVRRAAASGITALMMCRDCFAVSTPHQAEGHYSMYLSLFGRTIRQGETAASHARLILLPSATPAEMVRLYEQFSRTRAPRRKGR